MPFTIAAVSLIFIGLFPDNKHVVMAALCVAVASRRCRRRCSEPAERHLLPAPAPRRVLRSSIHRQYRRFYFALSSAISNS